VCPRSPLATDAAGIPIGWTIDAANRNDCKLLSSTLQAVAARGLVDDIATLHLDRGYDNHLVERVWEGFGITDVVCANGLPLPSFGRPTERQPSTPRSGARPELDEVPVPIDTATAVDGAQAMTAAGSTTEALGDR
jgi:hypothetical protein